MPADTPTIIPGQSHSDHRGHIKYVNNFNMKEVLRFYRVTNSNTSPKRGWRGHRIEQRWFCVINGAFTIKAVKIDNWESPATNLSAEMYPLNNDNSVLHMPRGYATCIEALEPNSELLIFADTLISESAKDDYLFPIDYFDN